jgi:3-methylfumaryl-CoA hydratase
VQLFRFSALTFNSHRIHYDRDYACVVEGYPGLVVHAPLQATLLLHFHLEQKPCAPVVNFRFRALDPLIAGEAFALCPKQGAGGHALWMRDRAGHETMRAELDHP